MSVRILLLSLLGNREAILAVASARSALGLGLLFVLSAGLAREYDGQDLLHEPWHALLPLGASLVLSFILYSLLWGTARVEEPAGVSFGRGYLSFLGVYWMTAPLAWLYAIPYERFLDPVRAVKANLVTLALVALWRVALMARVVAVLTRCGRSVAIFLVMLFADLVALVLFIFDPVPIINAMGGLRFSPEEGLVQLVKLQVFFLGLLTFPVWLVGAPIACAASKRARRWPARARETRGVTPALWVLAFGSVIVWAAILPFTQPEQIARRKVEAAFEDGKFEEALAAMSARTPRDFPPHWQPPPRFEHSRLRKVAEALEVISRAPVANWVREVYLKKLREELAWRSPVEDQESFQKIGVLLERLPGGEQIREEFEEGFKKAGEGG